MAGLERNPPLIARPARPVDWSDRHCGPMGDSSLTARAAYETGFKALPGWVGAAMAMRNLLMRPFGLVTDAPDRSRSGMLQLPVIEDTPQSYEVGLADRHLTFTVQTETMPGRVCVTTRIWFNHWLGRLYLAVVLIPHKIIIGQALRGLA